MGILESWTWDSELTHESEEHPPLLPFVCKGMDPEGDKQTWCQCLGKERDGVLGIGGSGMSFLESPRCLGPFCGGLAEESCSELGLDCKRRRLELGHCHVGPA